MWHMVKVFNQMSVYQQFNFSPNITYLHMHVYTNKTRRNPIYTLDSEATFAEKPRIRLPDFFHVKKRRKIWNVERRD